MSKFFTDSDINLVIKNPENIKTLYNEKKRRIYIPFRRKIFIVR